MQKNKEEGKLISQKNTERKNKKKNNPKTNI